MSSGMTDDVEALRQLCRDATELSFEPEEYSPLYSALRGREQRYGERELIATGGMKRIYRVVDLQANRPVAMACLHEDADDLLYDPFLREAQLTATLDHPNVISIHDVGVLADGPPFFTMDLKTGAGLDDLLVKAQTETGNSLPERLEIFLKVCDAVAYAHSRKVLHLDLKPANIQVGGYGEVLVCDWGLAKLVDDDESMIDQLLISSELRGDLTLSGRIQGTPGFMAPEQVNGEAKDQRTDVYSLGAILYATLTCHPPLSGATQAILDHTAAGKIDPPILRDATVPEGLSAVVMKAMALAPEDRYNAVEGLQKEVRAYLAGYSPVAHESSLGTELLLFYHRHRGLCNAVAVFVAIVAILSNLFVGRLQERRNEALTAATLATQSAEAQKETAARLRQEKKALSTLLREVSAMTNTATLINQGEDGEEKETGIQRAQSHLFLASPTTFYKLGVSSLQDAIREDPSAANKGQLGIFYFIAADYQKAKPLLDADSRLATVSRINDMMHTSFDPERHGRSAEQLLPAIDQLLAANRRLLANKVLAYDYATLGFRKGYYEIVERYLQKTARATGSQFTLDFESRRVQVDCSRIYSLNDFDSLPLLNFLQMKELQVNNAERLRAWNFTPFDTLETLDLSNAKARAKNLRGLRVHSNLQTLIVKQGGLPESVRAALPSNLTVLEK